MNPNSNPFVDERLSEILTRMADTTRHATEVMNTPAPDMSVLKADIAYLAGMIETAHIVVLPPEDSDSSGTFKQSLGKRIGSMFLP